MTDILKLIRSGGNSNDVLLAIAKTTPDGLVDIAKSMNDQDFAESGTWISATCRAAHIQKTLIFGGLIHFYLTATECQNRRAAFESLLTDLEISETQAYRCRGAWLHYALVFLEEPTIRKHFPAESIKLLSEPKSTDAARQESIVRARKGERISIAVAKAILNRNSITEKREPSVNTNEETPKAKASKRRVPWMFKGRVTQIIIKPALENTMADVTAVIKDLEDAISALSETAYANV